MDEQRLDQAAEDFERMVNSMSRADITRLANKISSIHPTLQQSAMQLFLECVTVWAKKDETGVGVDDRNRLTCQVAREIQNHLEMDSDQSNRPFAFIYGRAALPFV